MDLTVALAAAAVWLVSLVAGLRKLREARATASSLRGFGLTDKAAGTLAPLLPWLELAVVVLMLVPGLAVLGAGLALMLLAVFTVALVSALLRGKRPACNCFGQAPDKPISWWTAARNGVLLMLSGSLLVVPARLDGGVMALWAAALRRVDAPTLVAVVLALLLVGQTVLLIKLFSQQGRLLLRVDNLEHEVAQRGRESVTHTVPTGGPAIGALAPDFELMPLAGGAAQQMAHRLATRQELVLVFISPECAPCHELLDWLLHQPQRGLAVVVTTGSPEHNRRLRKGHNGLDIVIQGGQQAQDLYGVIGTPSAVRVRDGRIASPMAIGLAPIQSLFEPPSASLLPAYVAGAPGLT
jgi:hypothetical protein